MAQSIFFTLCVVGSLLCTVAADDSFSSLNDTERRLALLPWAWTVHPVTNSTSEATPTCPDAGHTLGMFAAVNLVGAIAGLITSNRRFVNITTCGMLGKQDSTFKPYSPLLQIGWQVGATFLNAWLISKVPGYSHVPITSLALLFLARPRFSWIPLLFLVHVDSYYSASLSTMVTEVVLQFVGAYTMGLTAHFASSHGYYLVGHHSFPHGSDAYLFYCGAIVFLAFMIMSIWSMILVFTARDADIADVKATYLAMIFIFAALSWVGSWLFWAGFIKLTGDSFCLPNLAQTGTIFALFSVLSSYTATLVSG